MLYVDASVLGWCAYGELLKCWLRIFNDSATWFAEDVHHPLLIKHDHDSYEYMILRESSKRLKWFDEKTHSLQQLLRSLQPAAQRCDDLPIGGRGPPRFPAILIGGNFVMQFMACLWRVSWFMPCTCYVQQLALSQTRLISYLVLMYIRHMSRHILFAGSCLWLNSWWLPSPRWWLFHYIDHDHATHLLPVNRSTPLSNFWYRNPYHFSGAFSCFTPMSVNSDFQCVGHHFSTYPELRM